MSREENHIYHGRSVPEDWREQFTATDNFEQRIRQATGLSVFSAPHVYTDPLVIRQRWLQVPGGRRYTDRALYHLFKEQSFRMLLRRLLSYAVLSQEQLLGQDIPIEKQTMYVTFLHDQDMLLQTRAGYIKGPQLSHIPDLGHTLEAWVATWLRIFQAERSLRLANPPGRVPIRHGVSFTQLVGQGDPGDIDVVALFPQGLILVECKSSLLQVLPETWRRFAWRAAFLKPRCALLLVDTPDAAYSKAFQTSQRRLGNWQFDLIPTSDEQVCLFRRTGLLQGRGPTGQAVEWEGGTLYAALVGREQSLEKTLEAIFQALLSTG